MYRVIDGKIVPHVRWGEEIVPIDDPKLKECIGQLVLDLYEQDNVLFNPDMI